MLWPFAPHESGSNPIGVKTFLPLQEPQIHHSILTLNVILFENLEGLTALMYTGLVEYSLIGAAVMYIVWRNVKQKDEKKSQPEHKETPIQINLKHTFYGIF